MKENKSKEVTDEVVRHGVQSQPHPSVGDKRKSLSQGVDLGKLPSRHREKKAKHRSSKPQDVQSIPPVLHIQILGVDSKPKDPPFVQIPSTVNVPSSSHPSQQIPQNLIGNEDLAWERFEKVVTDKDVMACYDMSLKDYSGVHDLFKVCNFFFFFFLILSCQ